MNFNVYGCGNMAQALVKKMLQDESQVSLSTFTPSHTRAKELADALGGEAFEDLGQMPKAEIAMIACKPQQVEELASKLKSELTEKTTLISILAGTTVGKLKSLFGVERVVRIMPNTPSLVGHGVNAVYYSPEVEKQQVNFIDHLLKKCGHSFPFDIEKEIDVITPYSGSGPAYIFEMARIMASQLEKTGVDSSVAKEMVIHTFLGASKLMAHESDNGGDDPETLRTKVTSKNGVTYEALEVFKEENLEGTFEKALKAAYNRAVELSK